MTTLVRAAVLTNYGEVARHLGLAPHRLLRQVGLSPSLLDNPEQRIPIAAAVALLEDSAQASGCPGFGLRMAESRQLSDFGAVSLLLSHQRTLREVLKAVIEYRHLLNESLALDVEEAGDTVILREEVVTDLPMPSRQAIDLALGVLFRLCAALLGTNWRPYSVNFTYEAPPDRQTHSRVFGCKFGCRLEFSSEFNGIVCGAADLDRPNPMADPSMARYAQRFIESLPRAGEQSIVLEVRKAIYLLLPMGRATIEQVAEGLGANVRMVQRQLDAEGESFTKLLNGVRRDLVLRYMANGSYSLAHIGELLGYSTPSSFTRWFAAQYGMVPAVWRATKKNAASQSGFGEHFGQ